MRQKNHNSLHNCENLLEKVEACENTYLIYLTMQILSQGNESSYLMVINYY